MNLNDLDDIPPGDRRGLHTLRALAVVAVGVCAAGLIIDADVLATHHLSLFHRINALVALIPLGYGAYEGTAFFRATHVRIKAITT